MIRKEVRTRLNEHGIEVPFPRMVMYNRTEEAQHSSTLKGK
jgi:moderate conductance mechanosensitive channel